MNLFSGIIVFTLIWWMAFFCMLPLNIQPMDKPVGGAMPGAPVNPGMKWKIIVATLITCVLWVVAELLISSNLVSYRDIAMGMRM